MDPLPSPHADRLNEKWARFCGDFLEKSNLFASPERLSTAVVEYREKNESAASIACKAALRERLGPQAWLSLTHTQATHQTPETPETPREADGVWACAIGVAAERIAGPGRIAGIGVDAELRDRSRRVSDAALKERLSAVNAEAVDFDLSGLELWCVLEAVFKADGGASRVVTAYTWESWDSALRRGGLRSPAGCVFWVEVWGADWASPYVGAWAIRLASNSGFR